MIDPNHKLFRWGPIDACPLFMYYTIESSFKKMHNIFGHCYSESVIIFENKKVLWILDNQNFLNSGLEFTKEYIINTNNKKFFQDKWNRNLNQLLEIFKKLDQVDLSKIDKKQLYELFSEFSEIYFKFWEVGMTLELTILAVETWLSEKLKQLIKDQKEYNEVFAKLTSPTDLTFYRQEEKELIEISKLNEKEQESALKEHQKKYYWIYNSYLEAKNLGLSYFLHNLDKLKKENKEQMLNDINNYSSEIKKEKKNIIEKLRVDETIKTLVKLSEEFSILQDNRKKYNFMADHYLELFAKEIENRFNINIDDVKLLLPEEIKKLIEGKLDKKVIQERKPILVIHCLEDRIDFITGKKAEEIKSVYSVIKKTDQSRAIQGIIASRGKSYYFRGIAKVLFSPKEIDKINEGDILVTSMTSPDYIIAMRKAGAIVTDEGGILCHAAIVSRELGITCVVGTEVATKMIKDGDIIEIHGGKGTVRIIESKGK